MEQTNFAEQLGAMYKKAMTNRHVFHAVSNLVLLATMPFERMMQERGVGADVILEELQTIARGSLIDFSKDGFDPFELSAKAVELFPELHKKFMEEGQHPTILDETPEVIQ